MTTPSPVQFVLSAFESSVQMGVAAAMEASGVPVIETNATAVLQVSLDDMKAVFKYQTDSTDILNAAESDIKYYVHASSWPALNPADGMMDAADSLSPIATQDKDSTDLPANKMLVAHDFVRYLALKLFNTHYGVDLFNNETELLANLREICGSDDAGQTWKDITDKLVAVGVDGDNAGLAGDAGSKYMTNADHTSENICRVLLEQMVQNAPTRFNQITNSGEEQSLPFEANDSISFKLTIAAAQDQELLTGVIAIPARSYEIRLNIVDGSPANTERDAEESA